MSSRAPALLTIMVALGSGCAGKGPPASGATSRPAEEPTPGGPAKPDAPAKPDVPAKAPAAARPDEGWRATPPAAGAEKAPILPSFQSAKLANGLTVLVPKDRAMLPIVSFSLVTRGGAALDPAGKAGLTSLTFDMLAEGAGTRDALEFSDALADLGASFGAAADRDRGTASISGLSRNADAMMALLADAVMRPRLADKDFARRKTQLVAQLQRARGSPQGLAFEALPGVIYGPKHPYGHPPTGTVESAGRLSLADVKRIRPKVLSPSGAALIASGAITLEEAVALAEKHLGAWKVPPQQAATIGAVQPSKRAEVLVIDKANAPQTMVMIGRPIFGRGHADEQIVSVLNAIYGGEFTSRLNMNLREDKGYSYGASSQVAYRTGAGVFVAMSAIRQDATGPGLHEMFEELRGLITRPPTEEEVALAKAGIVRGLPGAFERTTALSGAASAIFVYGLPLDYYVGLAGRYEAVTPEQVRAAAATYLVPELMQVLLVGDAGVIGPEVEKLGLGKLRVRPKP